MKRSLLLLLCLCPYLMYAQSPVKKKKYPSLLWEITGNGLKKPSFLFGTMHVSSKMAFHLADSFYVGIHKADVVALETNPESWQEDMSKYDIQGDQRFGFMSGYTAAPEDYFGINTLKFYKYDKKIERTLYSNPSTINNLLYRSYGNKSSDFEEDTYLDMYIYQCGKKWGKKVAGVEKYGESMKLMAEAYKDAAKDKSRKERSYDTEDGYSSGKLQEAYRTGNLDWLDSINRYNSFSAAFDEKFLYRRNEIQAGSIDSILRTGQSLFVGVGAAHLPGTRGVIEMLREKGYTLRPVKMGERDSQHKNDVEKLRVPVVFSSQASDDGIYKVDIPGKFYKFGDDAALDQRQYADMANGSYYMVTRIMTNAWMWGHSTDKVSRTVDSLLYENIPGKIVSKTAVVRNGYKGWDIVNKTRRGDLQRYNIFITPFEILVFKMAGTGDYIKNGEEAKKFFGSIQLREYGQAAVTAAIPAQTPAWKKYSPVYGGFAVSMPHDPYVGNDGSWIYDAADKNTNTQYRVIRTDIHNYHFAEEDTFDLNLMEESFSSSEFINKKTNRQFISQKGYPALEAQYSDKSGGIFLARYIIQGPHYYTLVAHGKQETPQMKAFLNSFEIKPYSYKEAKERRDTSLYFSVKSPVFPEATKEKIDMPQYDSYDDDPEDDKLENGVFRSKVIENDTTGEKVFVLFYKSRPYSYYKDSSILEKEDQFTVDGDSTWITRVKKKYELPGNVKVWERVFSDTGSSRALWVKSFYHTGVGYSIFTEIDTLTAPSDFVKTFYESFTPADTLQGIDPFRKKTASFFSDFMSTDSTVHKRAVKGISLISIDSSDLSSLQTAIRSVNWNEKKYLDVKKSLIAKLDVIPTKASADFLRELYYAAGDTVELQYAVLETLLQQQTSRAYSIFRDIVSNEPPVLTAVNNNNNNSYTIPANSSATRSYHIHNDRFMDELYDSLALTRTIFPDLLPLINLDDYKYSIMSLLGRMADSNLVKAKDYEIYFSKFLLEAKQELKKQSIAEKKRAIRKAERAKEDDVSSREDNSRDRDYGNSSLSLYATLLMPFWDSKPNVQPVINQMLASEDKRLKYNTLLLLVRNNKPYPDSMLTYFAGQDTYRYDLFNDLKKANKKNKFPDKFNNHIDLAKSKLLKEKAFSAPDSVLYVDRLSMEVKGRKGWVYFFKYKNKKDDAGWKMATIGLVPADPAHFEFDDVVKTATNSFNYSNEEYAEDPFDFNGFTNRKINEEKPLAEQLNKQLKRLIYSHRKSAKQFYAREENESYDSDSDEIGVIDDGGN